MRFTKMHGCSNDYLYINCFEENLDGVDLEELTRQMSDRHNGVGSDGLILIMPSDKVDFGFRFFNADGTEGEMCGNGVRCFAKYVYEHGLTQKTEFAIDSLAGIVRPVLHLCDGKVQSVTVDLGEPRLTAEQIPILNHGEGQVIDQPLQVGDQVVRITAVSMGNPHCVQFVDDVDTAPVTTLGKTMEFHPDFPRRVNVEFVQIIDRHNIHMRIWERGTGETMASGTGSSAAAVGSILNGYCDRLVNVHVHSGGVIQIHWSAEDNHIYMTGPATEVFSGEWKL